MSPAVNPRFQKERKRVLHPSGGRQMTKQSDTARTDINSIMAKWINTGLAPQTDARPQYGDFSNSVDFHAAVNQVMAAEKDFAELPARVRQHVENDPVKFLEMVMDPNRRSELEELGLVERQTPVQVALPEEAATPAPLATAAAGPAPAPAPAPVAATPVAGVVPPTVTVP